MNKRVRTIALMLLGLAVGMLSVATVHARDIDWSKIPAKTIKVFYPGQASWDFVHSEDHGTGQMPVTTMKTACKQCHVGENGKYDIDANGIIAGTKKMSESKKPFEPDPITGMPGFKDVQIKAAYDAQNIYLWFQWPGSGDSVADPSLAQSDKADKLSIQMNNSIRSFAMYGCFMTCHNDENGMPDNKGNDVKLYGYYTRNKDGSVKPQSTLDQYLNKGLFVDLWENQFIGKKVESTDEYILQTRAKDPQQDVSATGSYENGKYTLVLTRKLNTGDKYDIQLQNGKTFYIGIAIHDNKNSGRKHYVSFPLSIGLSSSGDIVAQKL